MGGVGRAAGDPRDAPRFRLGPHSAVGQRAGVEQGLAPRLIRRPGGDPLARPLGGDTRHEPTLNVALGIPRRPRQPPGLTGPMVGRPAWGTLGLGLRRFPRFTHFGRCSPRAAWDACCGSQAQQRAHVPGPTASLSPLAAFARTRLVTLQAQGGMNVLGPSTGGGVPSGIPAGRHIPGLAGAPTLGLVGWPGVPLSRTPWGLGGPQIVQVARVTSDKLMLRVAPWGPSLLAPWDTTLGLGVCRPSRPGGVGVQRDHVTGKACPWGSGPGP